MVLGSIIICQYTPYSIYLRWTIMPSMLLLNKPQTLNPNSPSPRNPNPKSLTPHSGAHQIPNPDRQSRGRRMSTQNLHCGREANVQQNLPPWYPPLEESFQGSYRFYEKSCSKSMTTRHISRFAYKIYELHSGV